MPKSKIKRQRKPTLEKHHKIAKRCWNLCRLITLQKYGHKCVVCGESVKPLDVHHLIPREHTQLRYDPSNLICLCKSHHKFSRELSAHKNSIAFVLWFMETFKDIDLKALIEKSKTQELDMKNRDVLYGIENALCAQYDELMKSGGTTL